MSKYRKTSMLKCPYCRALMANEMDSSDAKLQCKNCGKEYRVACSISFFGGREFIKLTLER